MGRDYFEGTMESEAIPNGFASFSDQMFVKLFEGLPSSSDFSCFDISKFILQSLNDQCGVARIALPELPAPTLRTLPTLRTPELPALPALHPHTFVNISAQNKPVTLPAVSTDDLLDPADYSWVPTRLAKVPPPVDEWMDAFNDKVPFSEDSLFGEALCEGLDDVLLGDVLLGGALLDALDDTYLDDALDDTFLRDTLEDALVGDTLLKKKKGAEKPHKRKNTRFVLLKESGPGFERCGNRVIYIYDWKAFSAFYGNSCIASIKRNANAQHYKVSTDGNTCTLTQEGNRHTQNKGRKRHKRA